MARRPGSRAGYVSASKLAQLGYCETQVVKNHRLGERVTGEQRVARAQGVAEHRRMDIAARKNHNRPTSHTRPSPCFIATAVYGQRDERTQELRMFRDGILRRSRLGRLAILVYYRVSPWIAQWLIRHRLSAQVARLYLDATRAVIRVLSVLA